MEAWRRILADSIVKPKDLADRLGIDAKEIEAIVGDYPMRITPTVMATIKEKGDAIWKQVVPDIAEMDDFDAEDDPLEEDLMSPVPHLVHRYPDRVLLMVTNQCPIYCRFCTRKRLVGKPGFLKKGELDQAIAYLREHTEVRDVILSGGDPLLLPDHLLDTDPQGPAHDPASGTHSPRLPSARHVAGTDHPGTLRDREEVPPDLYEPALQSPGRADPGSQSRPAGCWPMPACRSARKPCCSKASTTIRTHETIDASAPARSHQTLLSLPSGPDQRYESLPHNGRNGAEYH